MSRQRSLFALLTTVFALFWVTAVQAENWPQWRGARLDGVSGETNLPAKFGPNENVAWRAPLPGRSGATPVVWDNRIFVSSIDGQNLVLLAFDTTNGKELWKRVVGTVDKRPNDEGDQASPSPTTDGKHVWVLMSTGDMACYDFDGKEIWKKDVENDYGKLNNDYYFASSPVLDGGRLYLQMIRRSGAHVAALDAATGKEIWAIERQSDARDECLDSYASPVIYRDNEREFLITHGADYTVAHDLKDGSELWRSGGLNVGRYNRTLRLVASPLAVRGMIIAPSAKRGPVLALKPTGSGNITGQEEQYHWTRPSGTPDVPSPLVVDGIAYFCGESGTLYAVDARTGEELYPQQRVHGYKHRASPVYADGKIYLTGRDGMVTVIKAGPKLEKLASNPMGEPIAASPAISNGTIYLRSFDALYAIRGSEQAAR
jgi:outer membrane protein assembly factor BamB